MDLHHREHSCGLTYIYLQQCKQSDIWVDYILKQNINDQFIQRWINNILPNVLSINYINKHLALKNTSISHRKENISLLRNLDLVIILCQSKLVDIQIFPDKNNSVLCVIKIQGLSLDVII